MTTFDATVPAAQVVRAAPPGGIVRFGGETRRFRRLLAHGAVLLMCALTDIRRYLWSSTDLDSHHTDAAFECGNGPKEKPARTAFDKLVRQIETAADLPIPLSALVVSVALIEKLAGSAPTRPLLDRTEWAALKNICAGA